jgi:hypothetical protein
MLEMKGTELVLKALKDNGVKYIFGYTGGAIMPIFDEMENRNVSNSSCRDMSRALLSWLREYRGRRWAPPIPAPVSAWQRRAPAP